MRHSSGYYLATLALTDLVFLCLQVVYELHAVWDVNTLNFPLLCESFPVVFLAAQYLSPLLVLGFTVERYISVCHPFKREIYCTTTRAKKVILCFFVVSLAVCAIQGYFWKYSEDKKECDIRKEVLVGGMSSLWSVWTWISEILIFFVVPLAVLIFNVFVLREAKKLSRFEQKTLHTRNQKTQSTTIMLLSVSFYLIITTLPVTFVYALYYHFEGNEDYLVASNIIREIGMTHYACNFYIYLLTGKVFRKQFKKLFCPKQRAKRRGSFMSYEYRDSISATTKSTIVRLSQNGDLREEMNEMNEMAL